MSKELVPSTTFNGELSKHRGCSHTLSPLRLANGDRELRDTLEEALEYREVKTSSFLPSFMLETAADLPFYSKVWGVLGGDQTTE